MQRRELTKKRTAGDGSRFRIGIVVSEFNHDVTYQLRDAALETLREWQVKDKNITIVSVPGAFEIPLAAARLLKSKKYDALVVLGCVLKGETKHDEYISHAVSGALQTLMLTYLKPIGFGIITPTTLPQAHARAGGDSSYGSAAARAALEMLV